MVIVCLCVLKWGWVFLERTRILSGIQLTTHFIDSELYGGNETITSRQFRVCERDFDAANLRPALEQSCGKQTPSASKLFSRANVLNVPDIKMYRNLRSRSVHFLGTCEMRSAAQWRRPEKKCFAPGRRKNRNQVLTFKVGLGISRTKADSQWNPVYKVFYRFFGCGNATIRRQFCKRDLDAANLQPALEQGCGKQTPGAGKLFSRANLLHVYNVKMQRSLKSRSVHFLDTCEKRAAAQCKILVFPAGEKHFFWKVAITRRFSFRKHPKSVPTQILVFSTL